jgi:hypothetical protein
MENLVSVNFRNSVDYPGMAIFFTVLLKIHTDQGSLLSRKTQRQISAEASSEKLPNRPVVSTKFMRKVEG